METEVLKELGLRDSNMNFAGSFIHGSIFYETEAKGVFLTNYDINKQEPTEEGTWLLFFKLKGDYGYLIITDDFLTSTNKDSFYTLIDNVFN